MEGDDDHSSQNFAAVPPNPRDPPVVESPSEEGSSPPYDTNRIFTTPDSGFKSDRSPPAISLQSSDVIIDFTPPAGYSTYTTYSSADPENAIGQTGKKSPSLLKERPRESLDADQLSSSSCASMGGEVSEGRLSSTAAHSTRSNSDAVAPVWPDGYEAEADTTSKTPQGYFAPAAAHANPSFGPQRVNFEIPVDLDETSSLPLDLSGGMKKRRLTFEDDTSSPLEFPNEVSKRSTALYHENKTNRSAIFDVCQIKQNAFLPNPIDSAQHSPPLRLSPSVVQQHRSNKAKRQWHSECAKSALEDWYALNEHCPYASDEDRAELARRAGISGEQVIKWLANKRQRTGNTLTKNGQIHPKKSAKIREIQELVGPGAGGVGDTAGSVAEGRPRAGGVEITTWGTAEGGKRALDAEERLSTSHSVKVLKSGDDDARNTSAFLVQHVPLDRFLSARQVQGLEAWFHAHLSYPYPEAKERGELSLRLGLSHSQIVNWFANKRSRLHSKGQSKSTTSSASAPTNQHHHHESLRETINPSTQSSSHVNRTHESSHHVNTVHGPLGVAPVPFHWQVMRNGYQPPGFPPGFLPHGAMFAGNMGLVPYAFDRALMMAAAALSVPVQDPTLQQCWAAYAPWMQHNVMQPSPSQLAGSQQLLASSAAASKVKDRTGRM